MFTIPEQFSTATKTNLEAQFAVINALTQKAFESVAQVIDLNLNATKTSLQEAAENARQFLSTNDPQAFFALSAAQTQPQAEKALAYGRHLANIASGAQAEFTKVAEAQVAETNRKVIALVNDITKNAPAGSENAVAIVKSAIGNINASYEQLTKTTRQAVEILEENVATTVNQFSKAAEKTGTQSGTRAKR